MKNKQLQGLSVTNWETC